ncbi:MAG: YqaJ viral recombinase family protein [Lactobacillus sp.]|jgi:putative phage-type endonuclease|nr:YqaJ viral recombinase family protein [Lactobacillus sp.]MCI2032089.1 YqaJ viral recombinase family protein [Lactobacillus sp.]
MTPEFASTAGMDRLEWLKFRRKGIGGSDVAAILGLSPWNSPYSVWATKTGRIPITDQGNEFTHWGTIMEPILAHEFQAVTGKRVYRQNKTYYDPEHPYLRANIDRDIAGEEGFLEIKTATEYKSSEWEGDQVPVPYQLQVQHYMHVLDRPYVYFAYLVGGHHFGYKRVDRDQEAISIIEPQLIDWWEQHIIKDVPPDPDGTAATTAALRALYPEDDGEALSMDTSFDSLLTSREELKSSMESSKEATDAIDNKLRETIGEASAGETTNWIVTNKANKRGTRTLRIKRKKALK